MKQYIVIRTDLSVGLKKGDLLSYSDMVKIPYLGFYRKHFLTLLSTPIN